MSRLIVTTLLLSLLSATRVLDAATTWHFSPDLAYEGNPLARILGGGWAVLLTVNVLVCLLIAWATLAWHHYPPQTDLARRSRSTWDFAALMLYGRTMPRWRFLLHRCCMMGLPPKAFRPSFAALFGFVVPLVVMVGGLVAVTAWIAIHGLRFAWANDLHRALGGYGTVLIPCIATWFLAEAAFFRMEYRRAQRTTSQPAGAACR